VTLDAAGLSCCTALQKLRIEQLRDQGDDEGDVDEPYLRVEHLQAISSLTRLEHLHCTSHELPLEFAALQELRVLELPYAGINRDRWKVLERLPRLSELLVLEVQVDGSAAPLTGLTSLVGSRSPAGGVNMYAFPLCPPLLKLAPNLQRLHLMCCSEDCLPLLSGHTALKSLVVHVDVDEVDMEDVGEAWRERLLLHGSVWRSLSALEHLTIDGFETPAAIVAKLLTWLPALKTLDVVVEVDCAGMDAHKVRQLLPTVLDWQGAAVEYSIAECQVMQASRAARCKLVIG
jgi:hypothetical protein